MSMESGGDLLPGGAMVLHSIHLFYLSRASSNQIQETEAITIRQTRTYAWSYIYSSHTNASPHVAYEEALAALAYWNVV